MKILHLCYDHLNNPWAGGGQALVVQEVCTRLAERHEMTVVTGAWPGCPAVEVVRGVRYLYARPGLNREASRISFALRAAWLARSRHYDLIVDDISAFAPTFAGRLARRPSVAVIQGDVWSAACKYPAVAPVALHCLRANIRRHRNFIAVSPSVEQLVRQHATRGFLVAVVPNGVDAELLEVTPTEDSFLLFLGRLDVGPKGLDCLVEAYAILREKRPDIGLVIAGSGPEEARLRQLIRDAGLTGTIALPGRVAGRTKIDLLRSCLAVCLPSRHEGWGIVAIEAAACCKPVVGFDIVGLQDSVKHNETGLLVPHGDISSLVEAMKRIINDDDLRHALGENGRQWAANFTWDKTAERYETFYEKVLASQA